MLIIRLRLGVFVPSAGTSALSKGGLGIYGMLPASAKRAARDYGRAFQVSARPSLDERPDERDERRDELWFIPLFFYEISN